MNAGSVDGLALYVDEDRQPRATTILKNVAYVIDAHFELTAKADKDDTEGKHLEMFRRRASKGQCFHQPCLGTRESPAEFGLADGGIEVPHPELKGSRDLGWMLYDIAFGNDRLPVFFRPTIVDGVIDVARFRPAEARP
jgi:CRISPR-associated protein Cas5d